MQIELDNSKKNYRTNSKYSFAVDPTQRAWIEVSGKAIENNVRKIKSSLRESCKFMAVVKADGYGHDAKFVSENAINGGADQLGVATLHEGIYLRSEGIKVPILVLGNVYTKKDLSICLKKNLMPTISSLRELLICNNIGKKYNLKFCLHLKIDTGMSRLGFESNFFIEKFNNFQSFEHICIKGIYSHLSSADENNSSDEKSFTSYQKRRFKFILKQINIQNYPDINVHLANSAGTFLGKEFHFDMVRVGLAMYGHNPFSSFREVIKLEPALCLKSKISFIRSIDKDTPVSYGRKFLSVKKTKLAVISIGYADGICRKLSNKIDLIYKGKIYPQVGTITMDQLIIDVTDSKDIQIGDSVILLGEDGDHSISPLDWAEKSSTITWEVLCAFKNRLPRLFID